MTLIATDLEGTLSSGEMWRSIGAYLKTNGQARAYRRFIVGRMPAFFLSKAGLIDSQSFKNDWFVRLAVFFRGWSQARVAAMSEWVVEHGLWPLRKQAVVDELLAHARSGARLAIVSGGFEPIVQVFADRLINLGARDTLVFATALKQHDDVYDGTISGPVCTGDEKVARLRPYADTGELALAYGDTYADIPMLRLAAAGVAVSPDKRLAAEAAARAWRVIG